MPDFVVGRAKPQLFMVFVTPVVSLSVRHHEVVADASRLDRQQSLIGPLASLSYVSSTMAAP